MNTAYIEGTEDALDQVRALAGVELAEGDRRYVGGGRWRLTAIIDESNISSIEQLGCAVTVFDTEADPLGFFHAKPAGYPTAGDINARVAAAGAAYPSLVMKADFLGSAAVPIPRLLFGSPSPAAKVVVTAGMHAREWAPPSAVITCIEALLAAARDNKESRIGGYALGAADVATIFSKLQVCVLPLVNPQGYDFSTAPAATRDERAWRKNRRTATPNTAACPGVDVNRNFDFMWNFKAHYTPSYIDLLGRAAPSTDICNEMYVGNTAFSEIESQAIEKLWSVEHHDFAYALDIHSFGRDILYPWAILPNQPEAEIDDTKTWSLTQATQWDEDYKEYLKPADRKKFLEIAKAIRKAIRKASWRNYKIAGVADGAGYWSSGSFTDWAYAKHGTSAMALEVGHLTERGFYPRFNGAYKRIAHEVGAAILAFLHYAASKS